MHEDIKIIAGDDYCFSVEFMLDGVPYSLQGSDTAELVVHTYEDERIFPAAEYQDNRALFYLSKEDTMSLLRNGMDVTYPYCIRFTWDNGSRTTPLHRERMIIERC